MSKNIKQPNSPRAQENELAEVLQFMTEKIASQFKRDVLEGMDKKTVAKFEDAQSGNYAAILLKLSSATKRKILKQFNNDAITAMVADKLRKVNSRQQQQLYGAVEKAIGINTKQLISNEGMTPEINALVLETSMWVQKLRDESLEAFTTNTLFSMTNGQSLGELMAQFEDIKEQRKGHAKFLAHNQIQNFNAITSKIRVQKLGIKKAIWDTADDDTVRPSHDDRDGKEFDLSEGLYSSIDGKYLLPGVDYNCRCVARYVLDDDNVED